MTAVTLFNIFEVPARSDEEFVAWWKRTGSFIEERTGPIAAALHRSIDPAARFRFVNVASVEDPQAWRAAVTASGFPGADQPGTRPAGLYELVRSHADPAARGAVLIVPFEDAGDGYDLLAEWDRAPGDRLYRSLSPDADFRFVEVSSSETHSRLADTGAACDPALYEVVAT